VTGPVMPLPGRAQLQITLVSCCLAWPESGSPGVPMVQPADLRDGHDLALQWSLDLSWLRRVPVQGQVRAHLVVVVEDESRTRLR
jgi:hypothetical protein